jgi:hypothetical protein
MIILSDLAQPRWVDLTDGVRLHMKPVTTAVELAAQSAVKRRIEALEPALREDASLMRGLGFAWLCEELARYAVTEWEGVQDASGQPAACTPEALAQLMSIGRMANAFFLAAMAPTAAVVAEGNASGPVPRGTSGRARNTAAGATPSKPRAGGNARTKRRRH